MSGPTLLLEPMTMMVGKRYTGLPSTNSPVNTPMYGAGSEAGVAGFVPNSPAQPANPKMRIVATPSHMPAMSRRDVQLMGRSDSRGARALSDGSDIAA